MQTIKQRDMLHRCKVSIGSRYVGPHLDRPALRQLPTGTKLWTEDAIKKHWYMSGDLWVIISVIAGALLLVMQAYGYWGGQ